MKNIKLVFEYDGSNYYGYQRQLQKRTVQGDLEKGLNKILNGKINLVSAGRTDRGVHALEQVANFKSDTKIPLDKLKLIVNRAIPNTIKIKKCVEENEEFNSRFSAKGRGYTYIMKEEEKCTVFDSNYITPVREAIEVEKFLEILKPLEGKHNFNSFRKTDEKYKNPERTITNIDFSKKGDNYYVYIEADSFLKSMVRIIMGTALAVYFGDEKSDYLVEKLENPDINKKKIVAPASGLYLSKVRY
ncbi:MAG: tRNA pseudouridine(38-40) synthase TruA [Fusobacteriia bacterium 4572_132]|nr:MAG: tRNA pseudouridine(38-40) synthase TruA [Fusobacteriia bacterium 4572_132]